MPRILLLLCCALAVPCAASAQPATYRLDPVHTRVVFAVSHAGYSQALGTVSGSTGTVVFDPDDWSTAKLSVSIPVTRVDMGDDAWNRAVRGQGLLDAAVYPVATFVSTHIQPKDRQHAQVCGTLALHGATRDACLDVTFNQLKRLTVPPFRRIAGFSATATLSRKAFGIDAWPGVIGDEVQLRIEAEAAPGDAASPQSRAAAPPSPSAPPPAQP